MFISVSGPTKSGKSTVISFLKDTLPKSTVYVPDIYHTVWMELVDKGIFSEFVEITKDRDYLFIYISKVCQKYEEILDLYKDEELVVLEGCHLDYLIYLQLNSWYHYPLVEYQEEKVLSLLSKSHLIERVYITTADDENYPLKDTTFDVKTSKYVFRRNRKLEIAFYDIYRNYNNCVSLPSNPILCDKIIFDDLVSEGLI